MSFDSEYLALRKKRKKEQEKKSTNKAINKPYAQRLISPADEIAPVKTFTPSTKTIAPTVTTNKKDNERTWFKKGSGNIAKTILGTTVDVVEDLGTGIIGMGEKVVDALAMAGTAMSNAQMSQLSNDELAFSAVKNIGKDKKTKEKEAESIVKKYDTAQKEAKKGTVEFVKKDLYDEEAVAKKIITTPFQNATDINVEEASVLGAKSDALIQSGGQLLATAGLQAVGVPWFLTTGATSFGAEAENALNQGATFEQASMSAAVSAGAEILTEKLSGGIKFGGKTLDDALIKPLTEKISSKVLKSLANLGIDAFGEGLEEVVSGVLSNLGTALYKEENIGELLLSEEAIDEYIESFIGGAALGGFSSGVRAVANRNAIELTEDEQKVFDKVVEDRIAEATEDGKTISKKDESKIRNDVLRDMLKGYIDTETIESVLGGEEYETYKKVSEKGSEYETKLNELIKHYQAEYDSFSDMPRGEMSRNQINREAEVETKLNELKAELEEYKKDKRTSDLKTKLSQNVSELVKDSRLAESYREIDRHNQVFTADSEQYESEYAKKTIQNAIDYRKIVDGKEHKLDNSNQTHDFIDLMTKYAADRKVEVVFTTTEGLAELKKNGNIYNIVDPNKTNGFVSKEHKKMFINMDTGKNLYSLVGHEVTHTVVDAESVASLNEIVKSYLGEAKYKEIFDKKAETYKKYNYTQEEIEEEIVADFCGEKLLTDYDFVKHLSVNDQNRFKQAWDFVKHLYKMATAGSKEARDLEKAKRLFEKAYRESAKTKAESGTKHDIFKADNGEQYVYISPDAIDVNNGKSIAKNIATVLDKKFKNLILVNGQFVRVNATTNSEFTGSDWALGLKAEHPDWFDDKIQTLANSDEILKAAKNWINKKPKHPRTDKITSFGHGEILYKVGNNGYSAEIIVGVKSDGSAVLYDIIKITDKKIVDSSNVSKGKSLSGIAESTTDILPQNSEKSSGKTKHSLSAETENNYNEAVKHKDIETAQKIVDEVAKENGYTIKAYHGGDKFFTTFGKGNKTSQAPEGAHFFSSNKDVAYSYTTYKRDVNTDVNSYPVYEQLTREGTFEKNRVARGGVYSSFLKLENPYVVDFEGEYYSRKIDGRDINEIAEFARDNGYDGVIAKNIKDPGDMGDANWESKPSLAVADDYIVFNPNQIKSAEAITYDDNGNVIPLSERFKAENNDIRFSLSESVEETKDLMALHNLHSNELMKQLKMGGIAYPSVAVTKPGTLSHEGFGDITLILNKDAIDPKKSKYNKLYSADAYTPTFPNVNYEASREVANSIADKVKSLYDAIPEDYKRSLTAFRDYTNINERLNSARGEEGLIERYLDDYSFKQLYLADKGETVPTKIKRTETQITEYQKEQYQFVVDRLGAELLESSKPMDSYTPPLTARVQWYEQHGEALKEAYAEYWAADGTMTKEEALEIANSEGARYWVREIKAITDYIKTGGITVKEEADIPSTNALIDEKINVAEYKEWLSNLFSGIEGSSGIRNSKDLFTPSGKRRSFSQLHDPVTIDNIIKVMRKSNQKGQGAFGTGNIQGASTQEFGSVAEMKANSDRLGVMDEAEHKEITQQINDRIFEIADRYSNGKDLMDAQTTIVEAVSKYETKEGIARYLKQFDYVYKYTDSIGDDIIELRDYIRSIPTPYFEAKPQRAVGFDEVAVFVIPRDADTKVKQELLNKGYSIAEYDPKIEGDRQRVVNSFEQYKFSLSDASETFGDSGNLKVYAKDITTPTDIAPVTEETVSKTEKVAPKVQGTVNEEDYAPMTEEEAEAMYEAEKGYINSFTDADMPPETDAPIYSADTSSVDEKALKNISAMAKDILFLTPKERRAIEGVVQKYSTSEVQDETELFNEIKELFGEKTFTERIEEVYEIQQALKGYKINVSPFIKRDITDYTRFMRSNFGKISFSKEGMPVDTAYMELSSTYPNFFPSDIVNPTDQLLQMADVANMVKNETQTLEVDDDIIQEATDVITEALSTYKEKQLLKTAEKDSRAALRDELAREKAAERETTPTRAKLHNSIIERIKTKFAEKGFDFDDVLNRAKNLSTFATVDNTPQRVMEKALGYKQGQALADETVNKVAQNESEGIKWLNSFTDRKNGVLAQISRQYNIKPGSKKSAAAQMYAEGFYVGKNNEIIEYGDRELAIDFPDAKVQANIKALAKDPRIRQIYDETLSAINESRRRNLYPEIQRLDNYFLHFRAMEDTFSRLGLPFNPNDIRAKDLPTDLNGVTADLKPGQPYFASAMHREGMRTSFDLLGGLERYLSSAKNQIYHIDDIQTLRALRNYIADTYGQAKGLESIDDLTEEEAQTRIEQVYSSHLSTFAKFLNEEANVLAGKTTLIDRGLEGIIGRRGITFLNTLNSQVGSNMVGWNVSSSLTNFLPVAQTLAKGSKADFTKAFAQTVSSKIGSIFGKTDSFVENNPTIIRRKGAERFYRTPFQKIGDTGYVLMSAVDNISTELIVRTKYNELIRKGMDEQKASFEADKWVSRLMGDRSLGQQPQLFNSKMLGLVTKFQLEVRNQLDSQFYDTVQEAKVSNEEIESKLLRNAKTAAKVTSTFVQLAALQHLYGMAFESVAGYNPAFDIVEVLIKTLGFDDDEEDEDTVLDNIEEGFLTLLEDLPYTSTFTGGRIPISSALPIKQFITGKDQYGNEKSRTETLKEVAPYYVLPTGYGQLKKTAQGLGMFSDDHPIAGSYTDSGNLRYPVDDTLGNRIQAGMFGQYANENARTYFDEGYAPLKEKQIQEYAEADMPIADYWKYREGLKDLTKQDEKAAYINGLDISKRQKDVLKSYLYDEEGYKKENPEKYAFLEREGIGYLGYKELDEDTQSAWSWAFKHQDEYEYYKENGVYPGDYSTYYIPMLDFEDEDDEAYTWAFDNPEKATVGKMFSNGVKEYRQYAKDLDEIRADKDSNGKSISGSAKEKKKAYIWSLDIDDGAKYILFKNEYNADDTYNYEIIDYLNNRDDISYDEMNTILEELGFKVNRDTGYISWD